MPIRMSQVIEAWALSAELSQAVSPGATAVEIAEAEGVLGRRLSPDMRELYSAHAGGEFVVGNLRVLPLLPPADGDLALTTAGPLLRSWDWLIPQELLPFGWNGSDATYGLWFHEHSFSEPIVVQLGEASEHLAVVGDSFAGFLAGHSAYYLVNFAEDGYKLSPAMDALGLPTELRVPISDEDAYFRFLRWANPLLPDPSPEPYSRPMTPAQIKEIFRKRSA